MEYGKNGGFSFKHFRLTIKTKTKSKMPAKINTARKHVKKVNFNARNQIGRPVMLHAHGRSDRIVTMRWITSNVCSKDKLTVSIVMMKM